jgi:hypothetical protein
MPMMLIANPKGGVGKNMIATGRAACDWKMSCAWRTR